MKAERERPADLAARLREALGRVDQDALTRGIAMLREDRKVEAREVTRETERMRGVELAKVRVELEKVWEQSRDRDSGWDYGL